MNQSRTILISTLATSLLVLAGCTQTTTNTNVVTNTNPANDNTLPAQTGNVEVVTNTNETVSDANTNDSNVNSDVDTSDWLTYTNDEYGFSFRYPKNYFVSISKSTRADFIDDAGIVFMIGRKITDSQIDPVRITLYDHIVAHPTTNDINSVQSVLGPRPDGSYDNVVSETSYSVQQYSGENFRVKGLTGNYPVDEDHKLQDVAEYYYLDSDAKTVEVRLTDEAATGVDANGLLNSLQF